jgi:hypothetical protein
MDVDIISWKDSLHRVLVCEVDWLAFSHLERVHLLSRD